MKRLAEKHAPLDCPIIFLDNVADYFLNQGVNVHDAPTCVPPFEKQWCEFRYKDDEGTITQFGGTFVTQKLTLEEALELGKEVRLGCTLGDGHPVAGWLCQADLYMSTSREDGFRQPKDKPLLWIAPDGKLIGIQGNPDDRGTTEDALGPIVFAWSLMHCKNVVLREERLPDKLAMARKKKRGSTGVVKWHTLEIEPMKQVLRSEGKAESTGLKQALHICRGHFKDYRQSGLFGKVKGVFWWDSMVRGSSRQGVVVKDYVVQPPVRT